MHVPGKCPVPGRSGEVPTWFIHLYSCIYQQLKGSRGIDEGPFPQTEGRKWLCLKVHSRSRARAWATQLLLGLPESNTVSCSPWHPEKQGFSKCLRSECASEHACVCGIEQGRTEWVPQLSTSVLLLNPVVMMTTRSHALALLEAY